MGENLSIGLACYILMQVCMHAHTYKHTSDPVSLMDTLPSVPAPLLQNVKQQHVCWWRHILCMFVCVHMHV